MPDERHPLSSPPADAAGFQRLPETPSETPEIPEAETEIEKAFLSEFINDRPFIGKEFDLAPDEKQQGVVRHENTDGENVILFDTDAINQREGALITQFLTRYEASGRDGIKGTRFEWFFSEPDEQNNDRLLPQEFFESLVEDLKARLEELQTGNKNSFLGNLNFADLLGKPAAAFRKMAEREKLSEKWQEHATHIPITAFLAKRADGTEDRIAYVPGNTPGIDMFLVNGIDGKPELIIANKDPQFVSIKPVISIDPVELSQRGDFSMQDGSVMIERTMDEKSGRDFTSAVFEIKREPYAKETPIFARVRIMKAPIDIDRELANFERQKQQEEERERQRIQAEANKKYREQQEEQERRKRAAEAAQQSYTPPPYSPPPPSAPSTPRWNPPARTSSSN